MVNSAWGKKRVCAGCSVRYYDLKNPSPVCPKCGTAAELQLFLKGKKKGADIRDIDIFDDLDVADDDVASLEGLSPDVLEDSFHDSLDIEVENEEEI
jgi:hypothetical protein